MVLPPFQCGKMLLVPTMEATILIPIALQERLQTIPKAGEIFAAVHPSGKTAEFFGPKKNAVWIEENQDSDTSWPYRKFCTITKCLSCDSAQGKGIKLIVQGISVACITGPGSNPGTLSVIPLERIPSPPRSDLEVADEAAVRILLSGLTAWHSQVGNGNSTIHETLEDESDLHKVCDLILAVTKGSFVQRYAALYDPDWRKRITRITAILSREAALENLEREITLRVRNRIEKTQKEYFLKEKHKEIEKELGLDSDPEGIQKLRQEIESKNPPSEVLERVDRELLRLSRLQNLSPEAGVLRGYCEWIAALPWSKITEDRSDILEAARILDKEHYGLETAKERILEYIAMRQLGAGNRAPILCLMGPPGTGKTSLGRSIADALGRSYARISLGGVRDEAEIRGHRRTYVGALPGRVIQSLRKAGSSNPVILFDEVDKMATDFRTDPASALLEVLDPEQNSSFADNYLEIPVNLSSVLFIMTANSIQGIPHALLDRMELIEIPGYSESEKVKIAYNHIIPKQIERAGLAYECLEFTESALRMIIRRYTMESGVRELERKISAVIRKIAVSAVRKGLSAKQIPDFRQKIGSANLEKLLGLPVRALDRLGEGKPGLATGLAWTSSGGAVLPIESVLYKGEEKLVLTGNLGDIMKESARIAMTRIRAFPGPADTCVHVLKDSTLHIHVPAGAIPKDGPSAGIALAASIISTLTGKTLPGATAMTGEITLSGDILPVGGIREKCLAAVRMGIKTVLLPDGNQAEVSQLPVEARRQLTVHFVKTLDEAVSLLIPQNT